MGRMKLHFLISKVAQPYISRSMTGERQAQAPERASGGGLWPWAGHAAECSACWAVQWSADSVMEGVQRVAADSDNLSDTGTAAHSGNALYTRNGAVRTERN